MGYDKADHAKKHHPLISGSISVHTAHNVIHWGLSLLTIWAVFLSFWFSPNPVMSISFLLMWVVFGQAYNDGLSKESLLGFIPISVSCTSAAVWGWFLSHPSVDMTGIFYFGYVFFTILFQISWSGHLKEMGQSEKSNILIKMGAKLTVSKESKYKSEREWKFKPGMSVVYAWFVKGLNVLFLYLLLLQTYSLVRLVMVIPFSVLIITSLHQLTKTRVYIRKEELMRMSIMEILTIYAPLPLLLSIPIAVILMAIGILFFFSLNLWLWKTPHPAV